MLCQTLGERLDRSTQVGRRVLAWPGDPGPFADALALRLCGGLHFLAMGKGLPELTRLYRPQPLLDPAALWSALGPALSHPDLPRWLDHPPQTNEVGRSAVLMSGLLVIAHRFPMKMRLYELGASAGLNLIPDRYSYNLGGLRFGATLPGPHLSPDWKGPSPPDARVRIKSRTGVDLNPARLPDDYYKLLAYVWPDQPERGERLTAALGAAIQDPPLIDQGSAADWIEANLQPGPEHGVTRVIMHSIAFQYFDVESQRRVAAHIEATGKRASAAAPLAWLRFEQEPEDGRPSLRLRTWPGGEELLAWAHPHGKAMEWLAGD